MAGRQHRPMVALRMPGGIHAPIQGGGRMVVPALMIPGVIPARVPGGGRMVVPNGGGLAAPGGLPAPGMRGVAPVPLVPRNVDTSVNYRFSAIQKNTHDRSYTEVTVDRNGNTTKRKWSNVIDQSTTNKSSTTYKRQRKN